MKNLDLTIPNSFIFDFDSTIVSIETLDTIIKEKVDEETKLKIDDITTRCMNGEMDFNESLTARLKLAKLCSEDFIGMGEKIMKYLIPGIEEVFEFLREKEQRLYIVSGGFIEVIKPVAQKFRIPLENCFANDYITSGRSEITGILDGPLTHEKGKVSVVRNLRSQSCLPGKIVIIGDGMSDYDIFNEKQADIFIGCGFVTARPNVKAKSTFFVNTPTELIDLLKKSPRPRKQN